jgi:hypothetical protein
MEFNLVSTQSLLETNRVVRNFGKFFRLAKTPYDDPKMFLEGEWKFINEFSSEKFQSLEAMVYMYWFRHNEHLEYFQTLKLNSSDLISQINKELNAR